MPWFCILVFRWQLKILIFYVEVCKSNWTTRRLYASIEDVTILLREVNKISTWKEGHTFFLLIFDHVFGLQLKLIISLLFDSIYRVLHIILVFLMNCNYDSWLYWYRQIFVIAKLIFRDFILHKVLYYRSLFISQ